MSHENTAATVTISGVIAGSKIHTQQPLRACLSPVSVFVNTIYIHYIYIYISKRVLKPRFVYVRGPCHRQFCATHSTAVLPSDPIPQVVPVEGGPLPRRRGTRTWCGCCWRGGRTPTGAGRTAPPPWWPPPHRGMPTSSRCWSRPRLAREPPAGPDGVSGCPTLLHYSTRMAPIPTPIQAFEGLCHSYYTTRESIYFILYIFCISF